MSAPTINANAAIFFRILLMIGSFSCLSSSVKPKQSTLVRLSTYLLKQLKNSCSQIGSFGYISTTCCGVCVMHAVLNGFVLVKSRGNPVAKKRKTKRLRSNTKRTAKKKRPKRRSTRDVDVLPTTDEALEREGTYLPPTTVGCSGPF